jgi:hypothetical protein
LLFHAARYPHDGFGHRQPNTSESLAEHLATHDEVQQYV